MKKGSKQNLVPSEDIDGMKSQLQRTLGAAYLPEHPDRPQKQVHSYLLRHKYTIGLMKRLHNLRLHPQDFPDHIFLSLTAYPIPILHRLRHFIFIDSHAQI